MQLLEIDSFDVSTCQVFDVCKKSVGIDPRVFWKSRDEFLEGWIGPRLACEGRETMNSIRVLRL